MYIHIYNIYVHIYIYNIYIYIYIYIYMLYYIVLYCINMKSKILSHPPI